MAGADWTPSTKVTLSVTGFYSQQHDTIDYVKSATPNPYLPAGLPGEHLVRGQPEWAAFCRSGNELHVDSEEIADGADRVDGFAWRADRAAWA